MASPPNFGKAATSTKSMGKKPFPPKKAKAPPVRQQQPMPPQQQAPDAAGIAQQILGPRSVRQGDY